MHKRTREAIIRFHKPNKEKNPQDFFRTKLMLYLPWRNETPDLLGGYQDYYSHYANCEDILVRNENKYTADVDDLMEYLQQLNKSGPPQHIWSTIAPTSEQNRLQEEEEGFEQLTNLEEDLQALSTQPPGSIVAQLHARYEAEANKQELPAEQYRVMMRVLNEKQMKIVKFHRCWCKQAVMAMKHGKSVKPYRIFLSGPGGVGKSHVIKLIHSDTIKLLKLSGTIEPDQVCVLLTAPTGVAAFNIGGVTLHSALLLGCNKFQGYKPLTADKLNTLRSRLMSLQLLIIDEVSMVGSNMLLEIHKRLQEIKGASADETFGGVSVLAVGDLYQLPPVCQPHLFDLVSDPYVKLHKTGSLWKDEFVLFELDQIMRQKDDTTFAELLCRLRVASCTENDITLLKSRVVHDGDNTYPQNTLHVFKKNNDVLEHNTLMLNKLAPKTHHKQKMTQRDKLDKYPYVIFQIIPLPLEVFQQL